MNAQGVAGDLEPLVLQQRRGGALWLRLTHEHHALATGERVADTLP